MTSIARFRTAVEQRDIAALDSLFAPDVRFFSPVKFTPFEGHAMVLAVFGVLLRRVFTEFRYTGELQGEAQTFAGEPADSHVLVFRAVVDGKQIHGIDLVHLDEQGLIKEFTVMVRPLSAVTALSDAVLAGLTAEGLVPGRT
ncbi:nuclear transport factor 2 family protein [Amycolatopsis nigrescens]|uniref:nuclear transport factor 2 family protein n=1 Tax=Amycolatopsis nigrescens TaxID=381445 RepID=UPI00036AADD5|nr:nuclear transport factor 2 family protein [Amycolatopsis nigrescens]